MATQLETAFEKASALPEVKQREIADLVLREVATHYRTLEEAVDSRPAAAAGEGSHLQETA